MPINVSSTAPMGVGGPEVVPAVYIAKLRKEPTAFTVKDLAQTLASSRKDHLPEWRLAQYNGDLLQRHQWFGQFSNAINSAPITDDVELTYLETLVTGQA